MQFPRLNNRRLEIHFIRAFHLHWEKNWIFKNTAQSWLQSLWDPKQKWFVGFFCFSLEIDEGWPEGSDNSIA